MMISYKPLLKLLIEKDLKKGDLVEAKILSWATMAKLDKNLNISLEVVNKLCAFLHCQPGDIMEFIEVL